MNKRVDIYPRFNEKWEFLNEWRVIVEDEHGDAIVDWCYTSFEQAHHEADALAWTFSDSDEHGLEITIHTAG